MADMLHHAAAVTRGAKRALVVGDMPFLTYATTEDALENAGQFIHEAGVQAVKVEGGVRSARVIEALVKAGIPVMGHIGLTPQSANAIGKFRVQGKTAEQARALLHDALAVQEAGAFSVVLELVPEQLAAADHGAPPDPDDRHRGGPGCSGQVQIITDILGLGHLAAQARQALREPPRDDPGAVRPTRPTSPRARSPARSRPSGWTTRSSTRCSGDRRWTRRPGRARSPSAGSRSTATSKRFATVRRPRTISPTPCPAPAG